MRWIISANELSEKLIKKEENSGKQNTNVLFLFWMLKRAVKQNFWVDITKRSYPENLNGIEPSRLFLTESFLISTKDYIIVI